MLKLLDYSSQDDDVSPSVFHDNCEEIVAYIEGLMRSVVKRKVDEDLNVRYNLAARNSLVDMDWRVLKYGENILLGEVRELVDLFVDLDEKVESDRKRKMKLRLRANDDLDNEMKRLSQVIEDLDSEVEADVKEVTTKAIKSTQTPPEPKVAERLKSPVFKIRKVRPVSLNDESPSPEDSPERQKGSNEMIVAPEVVHKDVRVIFQKLLNDDSEWWKAIAKRNIDKMEETRRELERFSGHELVLGEFQNEIDKYEKEKRTLQTFIDDVDKSKAVKKDLEYDKKYEDMILKLIEFAKKDFIYKGFDPIIEQLKALSNVQIERRKKKFNINEIVNIYNQIDVTKYTYEELCLLERYYKEIIRKYKMETYDKENIMRVDRSPSLPREETQSAPPSYHRNVILNVHSSQNLTKNINHYGSSTIMNGNSLKRSKTNNNNSRNSIEIFDLTRTYPEEYYANNWWSIYEDILKNREHQFGSIDNWWNFYEAILNKEDTSDEELRRIRAVVEYRNRLRKPSSRMEEQMRMLEDVRSQSFKETEDVAVDNKESVRVDTNAWPVGPIDVVHNNILLLN